ncbi:MAG: hypothetical protein K6G31_00070 [Paludibacteraceae bacterium]|nr:hypothetical protein [Paludibacteraceae bacterium]
MGLYLNPNADAPDGCAGPVYAFRLTTLDGIYLPLGVDYTVRADKPFYTSELDGLLEEGLGITGTGLFKEETDDMRHLQSLYRQERGDSIDNTAAYIFILPKASVDGVKGDMPLTRPVGYVFASGDTYADGQTIAHELGHGLYSFQHAFDYMGVSQGETDNLMDYGLPQGEKLAVWQWNLISTHKNYTVPFLTDDEDGWINRYNFPQLVDTKNSTLREFYEKLINEMFDMNKKRYASLTNGDKFNSELDTLKEIFLGKNKNLAIDYEIQYLYYLAGDNITLKRAVRDYSLALSVILSAANIDYYDQKKKLKVAFCNCNHTGYDFSENTLNLGNQGVDTINVIKITDLGNINNPNPESLGLTKWNQLNTIKTRSTFDTTEFCNCFTLLHECIHILYYKKIDKENFSYPKTNVVCNCSILTLNNNDNGTRLDTNHVIKGPDFIDMANFRLRRNNYDATIKTENYFRVNIGDKKAVRTSFIHHGTITNQENADLCFQNLNCYRDWCNENDFKQVEFFMPLNNAIYELPTEFYGLLESGYLLILRGIKTQNGNEKQKFPDMFKKAEELEHFKEMKGKKFKNILNLE